MDNLVTSQTIQNPSMMDRPSPWVELADSPAAWGIGLFILWTIGKNYINNSQTTNQREGKIYEELISQLIAQNQEYRDKASEIQESTSLSLSKIAEALTDQKESLKGQQESLSELANSIKLLTVDLDRALERGEKIQEQVLKGISDIISRFDQARDSILRQNRRGLF